MNVCDKCGQPLPGSFVKELIGAMILRIVHAQPGISSYEMMDMIYADDPDGGPDSGIKSLHVHIHKLNKRLEMEGVTTRVRGHKWHGYRLVTVPTPPARPPEELPRHNTRPAPQP